MLTDRCDMYRFCIY